MRAKVLPIALCLLVPASAAAVRPDGTLLVVIDPGHGGEKDGALGPGGVREKDVSLQVARKLETLLEASGHEVLLTRDRDVGVRLSQRIKLANDRAADLFVSIHANSMPTRRARAKALGAETYFLSAEATDEAAALVAQLENADDEDVDRQRAQDPLGVILADLARSEAHADSSRLAYAIHTRLVSGTGARDRGVRQAPFFVLEGATMPAVLVEVGYISHPGDARRIASANGQEKIARSIAAGIEEFRRGVLEKKSKAAGGSRTSMGSLVPASSR